MFRFEVIQELKPNNELLEIIRKIKRGQTQVNLKRLVQS